MRSTGVPELFGAVVGQSLTIHAPRRAAGSEKIVPRTCPTRWKAVLMRCARMDMDTTLSPSNRKFNMLGAMHGARDETLDADTCKPQGARSGAQQNRQDLHIDRTSSTSWSILARMSLIIDFA